MEERRGDDRRGKERRRARLVQYATLIGVGVLLAMGSFFFREAPHQAIAYGKFKQLLQSPGLTFRNVKVGPAEIRGEVSYRDRISGTIPDEVSVPSPTTMSFKSTRVGVENDPTLHDLLAFYAPGYEAEGERSFVLIATTYVYYSVLMIAMLLVGVLLVRWIFGNGSTSFGFGRSKHKVYSKKEEQRITFKDVAGIEEAKAELREVVDFLQNPDKYKALGGRIPKGILLVGPPGTGKTLLARSVAGEAGVAFFSISGSDFVEMFVGVGASRVRDMFREAEEKAPCIIFIDELDAMGRSRSGNAVISHEEREQTLNQLLVEMDGFDSNWGIIIMGATNRPEVLDAALLRPGRFDRTVVVDRPDIEGREAILKVHANMVKLGSDVNLRRVAALTPGSAGADLANLVNEAALLAARRGADSVTMRDFDEAIERGVVGLERKSRIMRPEEKRRVAVHEAGHALVACAVPASDPVHKVSIIPRGLAGGYVLQRPDGDRLLMTREELEARIKVALGGTLAEEVVLENISTGATSDLRTANDLATRMVKEFGMSRLGRVSFVSDAPGFLNGNFADSRGTYSEQTAREIDLEVRAIVQECLEDVRKIIQASRQALEAVATCLMEKEVIEGRDLLELLTSHQFEPSPAAKLSLQEPHSTMDSLHNTEVIP